MITTDRLTLRARHINDADAVSNALQDHDVIRWLTNPPYPYTRADAEDFINLDHNGRVHFVHDADGICGCVSLRDELGYWLAKDRWGQGYMSEAARAVVAQRFAITQTPIISGYVVGNVASKRILHRLGFVDTHIKTVLIPALGRDMDVQKMQLSHADWQAPQ